LVIKCAGGSFDHPLWENPEGEGHVASLGGRRAPYEGLWDKHIVGATLHVWNLTAGTGNSHWLDVYKGAWDFPSFWEQLGHHNGSGGDYWITDERLRAFYDSLVHQHVPGVPLKFIGNETNGQYTYKQLNNFTLDLTWNDAPAIAQPAAPSPGNGALIRNITPTLAVNPAWDPNGDGVSYWFRLTTGADAESGIVWDSGWTGATSVSTPGLWWGQTFYWHVYTSDGYDVTGPNWVWSFRTDDPPNAAGYPGPGDGASVHTLTPTLSAWAGDPNGDQVSYQFQICTGPNLGGSCFPPSAWSTQTSWVVPSGWLGWNQTYWWTALTSDGTLVTQGPTWSLRTANGPPAAPSPTPPGTAGVVTATSPTLSAPGVSDPDGDPVSYQLQVATGADGQSGAVISSGWSSSSQWTPPAGSLTDMGRPTTWWPRPGTPSGRLRRGVHR
jgi:hypothetical protein